MQPLIVASQNVLQSRLTKEWLNIPHDIKQLKKMFEVGTQALVIFKNS